MGSEFVIIVILATGRVVVDDGATIGDCASVEAVKSLHLRTGRPMIARPPGEIAIQLVRDMWCERKQPSPVS